MSEITQLQLIISLTAVAMGYATSTCQIILLRELINYVKGNELSIAVALFFWLAGIGSGALFFTLKKPLKGEKSVFTCTLIIFVIICFFACITSRTFGYFFPPPSPGMVPGIKKMLICSALIMFFPGLVAGMLFPLVVQVSRKSVSGSKVYYLEAIGSMIGGVLFTFFFAGKMSHMKTLAFSITPVILSVALFDGYNLKLFKKLTLALISLIIGATLVLLSPSLDEITNKLRWVSISGETNLLKSIDTKYQRLDLSWEPPQFSIFSDGSYDFSFPDPYDTGTFANLVLLEHGSPEKVLLIGGNPIDVAQKIQKFKGCKLDYVQIDPAVMDLITEFRPDLTNSLFCKTCVAKFIRGDGRRVIRSIRQNSYDIVWLNLPDPLTLLINRYYTIEMYHGIKKALKKRGIMVTGFSFDYSSPQRFSQKYCASIVKTIEKVFPKTIFALTGKVNVFAGQSNSPITDNPDELSKRARINSLEASFQFPETFQNFFNPQRTKWIKSIFNAQKPKINTDMHPISYRFGLEYFVRLSESDIASGKETKIEKLINRSWRLPWWFFIIPGILAVSMAFLFKGRILFFKFATFFAMGITGAGGIILQIALLLAYQTFYGILYNAIGILYASFMAGLGGGTFIGEKSGKKRIFLQEFLVIINSILTAFVLPASKNFEFVFPILVFSSGFVTGFAFPVLCNTLLEELKYAGKEEHVTSAGIIDGADHIGASIGAAACALLLVPAFGLQNAILFVAIYKSFSLSIFFIAKTIFKYKIL